MPDRRHFLGFGLGSLMGWGAASASSGAVQRRIIPSTSASIPAVGLGTWQQLSTSNQQQSTAVIRAFFELGGEVVDTSPMYGSAEAAIGNAIAALGADEKAFLATKVWTRGDGAGQRQIEASFNKLGSQTIDLFQIHNLLDWRTHLATLQALKSEGRIRYVGITHYQTSAHDELARIIASEAIDFVQVNHNLAVRNAEDRVFPAAADHGVAVLVNRPYQGGRLFSAVRGQSLPDFAPEMGCTSFGQLFLRYILAQKAVTCVIPGTSSLDHLEDNIAAARGAEPQLEDARRIRAWFDAL